MMTKNDHDNDVNNDYYDGDVKDNDNENDDNDDSEVSDDNDDVNDNNDDGDNLDIINTDNANANNNNTHNNDNNKGLSQPLQWPRHACLNWLVRAGRYTVYIVQIQVAGLAYWLP